MENNTVKYKSIDIYFVMDMGYHIWFKLAAILDALGYQDTKSVPRGVLPKRYVEELGNIAGKKYPQDDIDALYVTEAGVFKLINAKNPGQDFIEWISDIIPEITEYTRQALVQKRVKRIAYLERQNEILRKRKETGEKTAVMYVIDYTSEERDLYYLTVTEDEGAQDINIGDMHPLVREPIAYFHETHHSDRLRHVVKGLLYQFKTEDRGFYQCPLAIMVDGIDKAEKIICDFDAGKLKHGGYFTKQ